MDFKNTTKNVTFALGLAWLLWGATQYQLRDWDVGVSLLMAGLTYATADWVVGVVWRMEFKHWLKAAFIIWFSVSGSYTAYWLLMGHTDYMVGNQWVASLCLYLLFGFIASIPQMHRDALQRFH